MKMKVYLVLLLPNVFQVLQLEPVLAEHSAESDGLVAMVEIRLEVLHEHRAICMLQIHALLLLVQLVQLVLHRHNVVLDEIHGNVHVVARLVFADCILEKRRRKELGSGSQAGSGDEFAKESREKSVQLTFSQVLDELIGQSSPDGGVSLEILVVLLLLLVVEEVLGQIAQSARLELVGALRLDQLVRVGEADHGLLEAVEQIVALERFQQHHRHELDLLVVDEHDSVRLLVGRPALLQPVQERFQRHNLRLALHHAIPHAALEHPEEADGDHAQLMTLTSGRIQVHHRNNVLVIFVGR